MTLACNQIEPPSQEPTPPIWVHRIPAWLLSVGLHVSLIAAALGLLRGVYPRGSRVESRSGGIVLVDRRTAVERGRNRVEGQAAAKEPAGCRLLQELDGVGIPAAEFDDRPHDARRIGGHFRLAVRLTRHESADRGQRPIDHDHDRSARLGP